MGSQCQVGCLSETWGSRWLALHLCALTAPRIPHLAPSNQVRLTGGGGDNRIWACPESEACVGGLGRVSPGLATGSRGGVYVQENCWVRAREPRDLSGGQDPSSGLLVRQRWRAGWDGPRDQMELWLQVETEGPGRRGCSHGRNKRIPRNSPFKEGVWDCSAGFVYFQELHWASSAPPLAGFQSSPRLPPMEPLPRVTSWGNLLIIPSFQMGKLRLGR